MPALLKFDPASDAQVTLDASKLLKVTINYPKDKLTNVLPLLVIPIIGEVPSLPAMLKAEASLQL
jgi:hypothetical protein